MLKILYLSSVALIVLLNLIGKVTSSPIVEYDKGLRYEEYIVEHEISASQARNAALSIDLSTITTPAGCQKCTKADIKYCLGIDLVNDHCCCDRRYHEVLPFIPHTCYLGTQICKPIVGDCAEYSRLRSCCCDKYVLQKWKKKSAGVVTIVNNLTIGLLLMLTQAVNKFLFQSNS